MFCCEDHESPVDWILEEQVPITRPSQLNTPKENIANEQVVSGANQAEQVHVQILKLIQEELQQQFAMQATLIRSLLSSMTSERLEKNSAFSVDAGSAAQNSPYKEDSERTPRAESTQVEPTDPPQLVRKVFDRFDKDQNGLLEVDELQDALKLLLGCDVSPHKFMKKFDRNDSGDLDIYEFGTLVEDVRVSCKAYVEETVLPCQGSVFGKNKKLPCQDRVFHFYNKKIVAFFVAFCILSNFGVNILEKQIDPNPNNLQYETFWSNADFVFNIIFLIELCLNMWSYGGPVRKFWASGWNVFDTVIVTVGVLTMANVLGPPLDKLKLMRAFRVFRLFKRIQSLNNIIVALLKSIPGVINAFVVMLVFYCIYAILAVELFRDFGEGGVYYTYDSRTGDKATIDAYSARGYVLGIEYYGDFMRALYTLFQIMTGESWSEAIVRPLVFGLYKNDAIVVGIFFVSFIILTQIVLINVVVAVLLENFVSSEPNEAAEVDARMANLDLKDTTGRISEVMNSLAHYQSHVGTQLSEMRQSMRNGSFTTHMF